ncbi:DUF4835 family protein [Rhodohalobacter sp. 614A]|uniref:type IX secretion system protein PorD n=1 Tax=Rhodohalobacter sp. 614A TaxID=2908649 RepID=UPI001F250CD1|nr:DUF4835 family protein [Rhodohalobacter sp. 614A]
MRFFFIFVLVGMILPVVSMAQEFDCEVTINDRQISGTSYDYLSELETDLENYINGHRWTNDRYQDHERIRCNFQIVLTGVDDNFNYTAEIALTMRRPIYNTNQESLALLFSDNNWRFYYPQNKNLVHDELQFDDLASFLDFYVYIMLGFDYDSFSALGGTSFYGEAQSVFELGQNSGSQGWGRSIGAQRNRYGLIMDINSPAYEDFRRAFYRYHRQGLDQFTTQPEEARNEVLAALELIQENKQLTNNNYLFDIFFSSKYTEIVAIFRDADADIRTQAYNILRDVDPAHTSEYEKLQS